MSKLYDILDTKAQRMLCQGAGVKVCRQVIGISNAGIEQSARTNSLINNRYLALPHQEPNAKPKSVTNKEQQLGSALFEWDLVCASIRDAEPAVNGYSKHKYYHPDASSAVFSYKA